MASQYDAALERVNKQLGEDIGNTIRRVLDRLGINWRDQRVGAIIAEELRRVGTDREAGHDGR